VKGIAFDVKVSTNDITITQIDIHTNSEIEEAVEVWSRVGSWAEGYEEAGSSSLDPWPWTMSYCGVLTGNGKNIWTPVPPERTNYIYGAANSDVGLYVTLSESGGNLQVQEAFFTPDNTGIFSTDHLSILPGASMFYVFRVFSMDRVFSGRLHYSIGSYEKEWLDDDVVLQEMDECRPSQIPSLLPTMTPSTSLLPTTPLPTALETIIPTEIPSILPTMMPSSRPSDKPSVSPTMMPSSWPSHKSSAFPTEIPSSYPSFHPSIDPSSVPSAAPVIASSNKPSIFRRTNQPSMNPSFFPSTFPSRVPSLMPSNDPSNAPSRIPTDLPSQVPSNTPKYLPSFIPTLLPSSIPSNLPTDIPSKLPSNIPTRLPSIAPTTPPTEFIRPSTISTVTASNLPSLNPSTVPTVTPSFFPTTIPTKTPTETPSNVPSSTSSTFDGTLVVAVAAAAAGAAASSSSSASMDSPSELESNEIEAEKEEPEENEKDKKKSSRSSQRNDDPEMGGEGEMDERNNENGGSRNKSSTDIAAPDEVENKKGTSARRMRSFRMGRKEIIAPSTAGAAAATVAVNSRSRQKKDSNNHDLNDVECYEDGSYKVYDGSSSRSSSHDATTINEDLVESSNQSGSGSNQSRKHWLSDVLEPRRVLASHGVGESNVHAGTQLSDRDLRLSNRSLNTSLRSIRDRNRALDVYGKARSSINIYSTEEQSIVKNSRNVASSSSSSSRKLNIERRVTGPVQSQYRQWESMRFNSSNSDTSSLGTSISPLVYVERPKSKRQNSSLTRNVKKHRHPDVIFVRDKGYDESVNSSEKEQIKEKEHESLHSEKHCQTQEPRRDNLLDERRLSNKRMQTAVSYSQSSSTNRTKQNSSRYLKETVHLQEPRRDNVMMDEKILLNESMQVALSYGQSSFKNKKEKKWNSVGYSVVE